MAHVSHWSTSKGVKFFCRHLIGLWVTYRHKGAASDEPSRFSAFSGTLISIADQVHFLTAGHILRDLEAALASDSIENIRAVLADTFGLERISDHPIPFDLRSARFFYIDDDDDGLDFGLMSLSPYYLRLLAKNGVIALEEKHWRKQENLEFDAYAMLGFPEEFASKRVSQTSKTIASPTMFPITRLPAPPTDRQPKRYAQFVGQLDSGLAIQSVEGMSGGPIFAFKESDQQTRYWIVALQSSWHPKRRIVYGCPLPIFASLLTT